MIRVATRLSLSSKRISRGADYDPLSAPKDKSGWVSRTTCLQAKCNQEELH